MIIMIYMGMSLSMVASSATDAQAAKIAATRIFELLDRRPRIDSACQEEQCPRAVQGRVEVSHVVFAYPTRPDFVICHGYSLLIEAGEKVGLCGPSGSGKSTLVLLIERFYDPISGLVAIDNIDVKTLNIRWLRRQMSLVGQEPVLFSGTVKQNILQGKPEATFADVQEAALAAHAHHFVMNDLHNGYDAEVGSY